MQRSDLQPYTLLLNDLDDAERGMVRADKNNKTLIMRLEECIFALKMQDELHNVEKNHNLALTFHFAASILILMTPAIIETIIVLTTLNIPDTALVSKHQLAHHYSRPFLSYSNNTDEYTSISCNDNYPIKNFNDPWPYAHPDRDDNSMLSFCYDHYRFTTHYIDYYTFFGPSTYRNLIIAATSGVSLIISSVLFYVMYSTAPQRQRLFSDRTTLAMLPKKIQDEIKDLATKSSTVITDSHNINEIIQALQLALEKRHQARQRRAFLSGKSHPESPLYRFFQADIKDSNHNRLPGDGDHEITKIIFGYAGLLK